MADWATQRAYDFARKEGRLCAQCGGPVAKHDAKKGHKVCWFCRDANRGVSVVSGEQPYEDEAHDLTGEHI